MLKFLVVIAYLMAKKSQAEVIFILVLIMWLVSPKTHAIILKSITIWGTG